LSEIVFTIKKTILWLSFRVSSAVVDELLICFCVFYILSHRLVTFLLAFWGRCVANGALIMYKAARYYSS